MVNQSGVFDQIVSIIYFIVKTNCFSNLNNMSSQYYLVNDLLLYCVQYCNASNNPKLVITN